MADCLKKSPDDRIPAQALLGSPWVIACGGGGGGGGGPGAVSLNADLVSAAANVKRWIDSL